MATKAHCAYCFECLSASFEHKQPPSLTQVEELWDKYHAVHDNEGRDGSNERDQDQDEEMTDIEPDEPATAAKPAAISRLLNNDSSARSASSSSSSLPSSASASSRSTKDGDGSGTATPASSKTSLSSKSSLFSFARKRTTGGGGDDDEAHPLFVTWNTVSKSGYQSLRGCIGTFEAQGLHHGLRAYALTSAFEDARFAPIPSHLLPSLSCHVTLLTNFSSPTGDPMDWTIGKHGIRISFSNHGRRYGATYLPDVAKEQGWTKEEAIVSLMRKAGWNGGSSAWRKTWDSGKGELVTYEGKKVNLNYADWKEWHDWLQGQGVRGKLPN